ncbi:hypothetical protein MCOR25_005530 [Pyricularia grisea]|uniref:Inhibitor I9 domain-containing protein n=1 Tax=Pyricularia grisea TaxID=148305 RepID=A0A6P8AVC4_PYRGI|nr:uncharacterized protein PgNI_08178 [Pyricularia grisea]KAI6364933.1 hypothetical protein MCOR25_005530 [Pyricularia grisea]TLD06173.1 hypothetical protein PgNI_08178 [Pyricularia grisea]
MLVPLTLHPHHLPDAPSVTTTSINATVYLPTYLSHLHKVNFSWIEINNLYDPSTSTPEPSSLSLKSPLNSGKMKLSAYVIAALTLVSTGLAVEVKKQVIVTYPSDTPDSVIQAAKDKITESGGVVTHSYDIIKGFSATVGESMLNSMSTEDAQYKPTVEEEQILSIYGDA